MPTTPTNIQNPLSNVYALSFFNVAQYVSKIASIVLTTQTNIKGLAGPNHDTNVKQKIRITTPAISIWGI
jgi:hypothetical protein